MVFKNKLYENQNSQTKFHPNVSRDLGALTYGRTDTEKYQVLAYFQGNAAKRGKKIHF
jgi:hypothetical protein